MKLHRLRTACAAAAPLALLAVAAPLRAQGDQTPPTLEELSKRMDAQEQRIDALRGSKGLGLDAYYDKGFRLRSADPEAPFELRINGRMQFRYGGFDADRNGRTSATPAYRNDFEIERGRLEFRGTFMDKATHFFINLDADTDDNHSVIFHDFWVNHEFSKALDVYVGKAFVPASREWLNGSTRTQMSDRTMATTFFRPDRSVGIWAIGEPVEDLHYRFMIGNGFNTTDLESSTSAGSQIDTEFAYSGSVWWEPLADYGKGYADLEHHEELALQVGASAIWAPQEDGQLPANREADAIRLSDGTTLTSLGVTSFDLAMASVDAAAKFMGCSLSGEAYFRSLRSIRGGPASLGTTEYDWGWFATAGYMIVPKCFEVVARTSTVQGDIRDSWEYAVGVNYYANGDHTNKFSFDATKLDGSPTDNSGPDLRVGDDGWLFRAQWQIAF